MHRLTVSLPLTAGLLAASPALGQTLVDIDFTSGTTTGAVGTAYQAESFTAVEDGLKPIFTIADDAAGLGGGNAAFIESGGSGSEWYIPFSEPVQLVEGTTIRYSFDMRLDPNSLPASGNDQFYVGIFADADGSLGQTFDADGAGTDKQPAVFGSENGDFSFDPAAANGNMAPIAPDFGMHARIPTGSDNIFVLRQNSRMRTENANQNGVMSGSGETVASPSSVAPDSDFVNLGLTTTSKHTFVGEWSITNVDGELMLDASYTMTDVDGTSTITGDDPFTDPDLSTFDDTFHYMVFENIGDFDYVIDNILVEFIGGATVIAGDYDTSGQVEQGDLDIVLQNWGTGTFTGDEAALVGGGPFDGTVDQNELDGVLQNWGSTSAPSFDGAAVPEPAAATALLGLVGVTLRRRCA